MDRAWHILRVKPTYEVAVAAEYSWCHAYLPIATTKHINRRNRTSRLSSIPMFPGYVFVLIRDPFSLDLSPVWSKTYGFLRNGLNEPLTITEDDISHMMELEQDMYKVPVRDASAMFEIGQRVKFAKLTQGSGEALSGVVDSVFPDHITVSTEGPFRPIVVRGDALRTLSPV